MKKKQVDAKEERYIAIAYEYNYEVYPSKIDVNITPERVVATLSKTNSDFLIANRGFLIRYQEVLESKNIGMVLNYTGKGHYTKYLHNIACPQDIEMLNISGVYYRISFSEEQNNLDAFHQLFCTAKKSKRFLVGTVLFTSEKGNAYTSDDVRYGAKVAYELGFDSYMFADVYPDEKLDDILLDCYVPVWLIIKKVEDIEELFDRVVLLRDKGINCLVFGRSLLSRFDAPLVLKGIKDVFVHKKEKERAVDEIRMANSS